MDHRNELAAIAGEYVESQGYRYEVDEREDRYVIHLGMNLDCRLKSCILIIDVQSRGILTYAICPLKADESARDDVAEFITRANYGMINGCFEMDHSDGEVRFRTFLPAMSALPDMDDVELSVDLPVLMLERYGNGLARNIMGFGDPENDIKEIEG